MAFHWEDGWYFERLIADNEKVKWLGTVHVYHIPRGREAPDVDIQIDAHSWCSIIAAVSAEGETAYTWPLAKAFHGVP